MVVPGRTVDLSRDALAIAVAAVVFLLVNDTLVTVVISLSGRSFLHEWAASFREMGILYVSMAPLGALLAFAYQDSRWNVLYFPFLILVIYNGFKLYANLQSETDHALVLLADTVDKRDEYTYAHSQRVAEYAGEIARTLDLPRKEIDLIVSAARVHDLGKIATDNRILYKQASLTEEERKAIIAHPADGSELAGQFSMYRKGCDYIRHHHERWDGRGYPDGLAGTHIPLRRAHHHRGRRLRRHDLRQALPGGALPRDRPGRAAPGRRPPVRPRPGRSVHRLLPGRGASAPGRASQRDRGTVLVLVVAVVGGLLVGALLGGTLANLEHLSLRFASLVVLALLVQIVAFSPIGARLPHDAVIGLHIGSYVLLLICVAANIRRPPVMVLRRRRAEQRRHHRR